MGSVLKILINFEPIKIEEEEEVDEDAFRLMAEQETGY